MAYLRIIRSMSDEDDLTRPVVFDVTLVLFLCRASQREHQCAERVNFNTCCENVRRKRTIDQFQTHPVQRLFRKL